MTSTPKVTSRWAHAAEITGVSYTFDGSYVITASEEFTMHLFPQKGDKDDSAAEKIETQEPVSCMLVTSEHIFTGSNDCIVRQYDIKTKDFLGIIIRCDLPIRCLVISPDGVHLAVGTESPDIKIINLEDPEKCWSFRGHKKAINCMDFDPEGEFLLSSSCDGTVIVWNLKSRDTKPVEIINVSAPFTTEMPVLWHPSNEFFIIGKDKDVTAYHRLTWKKSFTYRSGSSNAVRCFAWSPNGRFLATASVSSDLWIWQYKEKEAPLLTHKHKNGGITGIAWAPKANRLAFTDTMGELSRWEDVVDPEKGAPFKSDPLDGLFDDAAKEDNAAPDQEMAQEFMDDNESLNDFVVNDDDGGYLERRPASGPSAPVAKSGAQYQSVKELHPRFQSGSTLERDNKRYLEFNLLGTITTVNHETHATVSVEFHDKITHRGYHFTDTSQFTMACLGNTGALFASLESEENPSTVFYRTYDSWATKSEWQVHLPKGEEATAIALNAESAIVTTSRGYLRVFSQSGIQTGIFCAGSAIAAAGKEDLVMLILRAGEPFAGSQNLSYSIYNIESGQRIQHGSLPVSDETFVTWIGFSEGGIPAFYDDNGVMHILNYYRRVDQGQWTPILDTRLEATDEKEVPRYWVVGLTDEAMTCVRCKKGQTEPSFPKPFVTDISLRMPTLYQETPSGQHEEAWLRTKILSGLNKDEKMATMFLRTDEVVTKKELEMDKLALQMIDAACRADRAQKALDLAAMLCNIKSIEAAVKIAHHHNLHGLMEKINKVREIKMMAEQDRDPDAELDLIMADPELATRPRRDQGVYQVATRAEEEDMERRTFERPKESILPNDPFGRRVVKEKPGSTKSGTTAVNPFRKRTGDGNVGKGFGKVVQDSPTGSNGALPTISRRATDLFDTADNLVADEQRAKADRERPNNRAEDPARKRKANGAAAAAPGSEGSSQQTLSMFSRRTSNQEGNNAQGSGSKLEAKRQRMHQDDDDMEGGASGGKADTMMEADDFMEEEHEMNREGDEDEELEESQPPAAQVIPPTQDEDEEEPLQRNRRGTVSGVDSALDKTIEETRNYLEQTRVASGSSSNILAGFKFNGGSS
ncbi:hypothetical protein BGW38_002188 [Lunasporangiospora selenospora]|uniref:Minichromosome loss protein Mcl1 middle region domain-containing protein n=1 Tax=Lunasporangiospora selenospora TaxID=979761 RepID=A0A9P6FT26_9FUNG|nr:hypothetical protein BGW38_002188 [Lunasporangiospora selenospora]